MPDPQPTPTALGNAPEARSPTGEIQPQPIPTPELTPTDGDKPSLLNEKPVEGEAKPETKPGAPDKYTDFTVPEGFTLDAKVSEEASAIFKNLNLPQEAAQSLVDFYTAKTLEAAEAPYKAWSDTQAKWQADLKADPEIGGKLDEVRTTVARAIDGLGDPALATAFREAMDFTGAGNHPAFVKAFFRLAQRVTEGGHVAGRGPAEVKNPTGRAPSPAVAMYPHLANRNS